jgi:hypothetical protein
LEKVTCLAARLSILRIAIRSLFPAIVPLSCSSTRGGAAAAANNHTKTREHRRRDEVVNSTSKEKKRKDEEQAERGRRTLASCRKSHSDSKILTGVGVDLRRASEAVERLVGGVSFSKGPVSNCLPLLFMEQRRIN